MRSKIRHISILQFDEQLISLLRVQNTLKGLDITSFVQERGTWSSEDGSLQRALRIFITENGVAQDKIYTVLSRYDMTGQIMTLPSQDPSEISGMVRLNADEYVPYPVEELVIDHCVLEKTQDGQSRVFAVFAHQEVVETHMRILDNIEIEPEHIYLSTACIASAAIAARGNTREHYALIDLSSGGLEALVLEGDQLHFNRAVATVQDWGLDDSEADETKEELLIEARSSLSAYRHQSDDGKGVDTVYISSSAVDPGCACEVIGEELSYKCHPAVFSKSLITRGVEEISAFPLSLLGAALMAQGRAIVAIDLLPESVHKARVRAKMVKTGIRTCALVACIILSLCVHFFINVNQRREYIRELELRIAELAPDTEGVSEKRKQLKLLQRQVLRTDTVLEVLAQLCEQMPESKLNINRLTYKRDESIFLSGRSGGHTTKSARLAEVDTLTEKLRMLNQFVDAFTLYSKDNMERGKTVSDFAINIPLSGPGEQEEGAN